MKILFLGAHLDDIELGCGGTVAKLIGTNHVVKCVTVTGLQDETHKGIDIDSVNLVKVAIKSMSLLGVNDYQVLDFPNICLYLHRQKLWTELCQIRDRFQPDYVYTQCVDTVQDHVTVNEESHRVFKTGSVIEYASNCIDVLDHKLNFFQALLPADLERKYAALREYRCFAKLPYMQSDVIEARVRLHGVLAGCKFAEGFQAIRIVQ